MSTAAFGKRRGGALVSTLVGLGSWPLFALLVAALVSVPVHPIRLELLDAFPP